MRWLLPIAALAAVATTASACSSAGAAGSSAPASTSNSGSSSPSNGSSANTPEASVPIADTTTDKNSRGLLVQVSVGGGASSKVLLDTGSSGLVITSAAVGSDAKDTGQSFSTTYSTSSVKGTIKRATVTLLGGARRFTTKPVGVGVIDGDVGESIAALGAVGILGIAPGIDTGEKPEIVSPLASLPGNLAAGYTVDVAAKRLDLGAPTATGDVIEIGLTKASWTYANDLPGYSKVVSGTWTFGTTTATLPTVLDTGGQGGAYGGDLLAPSGVSFPLPMNTVITLAFANTAALTLNTSSDDFGAVVLGSAPYMNTGLPIFDADRVGFDLKVGRVVITPNS